MNASNRRKLSGLLIDPRLQGRYLMLTLIPVVLVTLAFAWLSVRNTGENFELIRSFMDVSPEMKAQIDSEWRQTLWTMGLFCAFVTAATLAVLLRVSHRLLGPIFRIRIFFRSVADGRSGGPFKLRDRDEFKDLEPLINGAFSRIATDLETFSQHAIKLVPADRRHEFEQLKLQHLNALLTKRPSV